MGLYLLAVCGRVRTSVLLPQLLQLCREGRHLGFILKTQLRQLGLRRFLLRLRGRKKQGRKNLEHGEQQMRAVSCCRHHGCNRPCSLMKKDFQTNLLCVNVKKGAEGPTAAALRSLHRAASIRNTNVSDLRTTTSEGSIIINIQAKMCTCVTDVLG